jgi:hypothetical protein
MTPALQVVIQADFDLSDAVICPACFCGFRRRWP